jgi:hypothetical protein
MKLMVLDIFYKGKEYYGLKIFHMLRSLPVVLLPSLVSSIFRPLSCANRNWWQDKVL